MEKDVFFRLFTSVCIITPKDIRIAYARIHFNWHYNVLRLLSYNLTTLYRYRQRTLWTY